MAISCLASQTHCDVRCPVCGKGYLLLWEPSLHTHRSHLRRSARQALAAQHTRNSLNPHAEDLFDLPTQETGQDETSLGWYFGGTAGNIAH